MLEGVLLVFFGIGIGIFIMTYKRSSHDGKLVIRTNQDGGKIFSLELDKDPSELETQHSVSFKVAKDQEIAS